MRACVVSLRNKLVIVAYFRICATIIGLWSLDATKDPEMEASHGSLAA